MRYYDPEIGRYLTRDPIGYGDGLNVYLYVHNNPINHIDPLGLSEKETWGEYVSRSAATVVAGDFVENQTIVGICANVGVGLVPIVGQVADARDTVAGIKNVWQNPKSGSAWLGLTGAVVGWIPGLGDAAKPFFKGGKKVATELAQQGVKQLDEGIQAGTKVLAKGADDAIEGAGDIGKHLSPEGIKPGATRRYGDYRKYPGDDIEGHELWQDSHIKQGDFDNAVKNDNPALALTQRDHKVVSKAQGKAGLHNPAQLAEQTPAQNLRQNVKVVKDTNVVTRDQLAEAARQARKHVQKSTK